MPIQPEGWFEPCETHRRPLPTSPSYKNYSQPNRAVVFINWLDRFDGPHDYEEADQSPCDDPTRNHLWRVARFRTSLRKINQETKG